MKTFAKFFDDLFRQVTKDPKAFFERFKQWLDELIQAIKKELGLVDEVAEGFTPHELDWMASRKTGNLGENILKETQIRKLRGLLKEKGIALIVEGDIKSITKLFKPVTVEGYYFEKVEDLFYFMNNKKPPLVGGFDAVNKQFILPKNPTELVVFHEMAHVKHFEQLGESYYKLNKLQKETYVLEQILANRNKWTNAELKESLRYINDTRINPKYGYNLEPIKIK